MKNIVYFIVIFFWILSMVSKSKRQKQQAQEREQALKNPLRQQQTRRKISPPENSSTIFSERISALSEGQKDTPDDYESPYASSSYMEKPTEKAETGETESEHEPVSHFQKNYGMKATLGTESSEEKDAYDKDLQVAQSLSFSNNSIKQYFIASEILGKPKALRK
jgi:hypothetical protein